MRRYPVVCALSIVTFLTACQGPDSQDEDTLGAHATRHFRQLQDISGEVVGRSELVIAPTRGLQVSKDRKHWLLRASAALVVSSPRDLDDDLVVTVRTASDQACSLGFWWDGNETPIPVGLDQPGVCELRLPAAAMTHGTHVLTMYRREVPGSEDYQEDIEIQSISARVGAATFPLPPASFHRLHYISDFLAHGVTGSRTTEHLGGVLFDGPVDATVDVVGGPGVQLNFRIQNSSPGDATFRLASAGAEISVGVASHGKATLRLPIADGHHVARLSVDGPDNGLYLWGAPQMLGGHDQQPPIVLLTLDTTRLDVVPPAPGSAELMPEVAAFAAQATVYARAVTTAPWTLPSHASMLSGLYPSHHRAGVTDQELAESVTTAAELLADAGYFAAGVAGGFFCNSRFGLSQGFALYHNTAGQESTGDVVSDHALSVIRDYRGAPLFLFANFFDPHYPYRAPEDFRSAQGCRELAEKVGDDPDWQKIIAGDAGLFGAASRGEIRATDAARDAVRGEYRAEVAFMDHHIGRVLTGLKDAGLYDRALIVLVADHGELLGEEGHWGHGCRLDPELIHVPMIVKLPNQAVGKRVEEVVSIVDVFPTMLAAAGIVAPPCDGMALQVTGARQDGERVVYSEEHAMGIHKLIDGMKVAEHLYSVEHRDHRQVIWSGGHECSARRGPTWEKTPCSVASEETMAQIVRDLQPPAPLAPGAGHDLSEDEQDALRALGYLQ